MNVILNRPLVSEADCDPFARQRLIPGWDQEKIENARVFVPGVGAIGCAALLNLMLMGFKNLYIADMDRIETSNLSRTPLFRKGDEGQYKAVLAAKRLKELSPFEDVCIDAFTGDITRDLGSGVFRRFDLVLGCLDNDATRYHEDDDEDDDDDGGDGEPDGNGGGSDGGYETPNDSETDPFEP